MADALLYRNRNVFVQVGRNEICEFIERSTVLLPVYFIVAWMISNTSNVRFFLLVSEFILQVGTNIVMKQSSLDMRTYVISLINRSTMFKDT